MATESQQPKKVAVINSEQKECDLNSLESQMFHIPTILTRQLSTQYTSK